MRTSLIRYCIFTLLVLLSCIILSSCDLTDQLPTPTPTPLAISAVDTSAPKLIATVTIDDNQNASDGKVTITLRFRTTTVEDDNYVKFTHGETVTCNEAPPMKLGDSLTYSVHVLVKKRYECSYVGFNQTTLPSVKIVDILARTRLTPELVVPVESKHFMVHYTSDTPEKACPVEVDASQDNGPQPIKGPRVLEDGSGIYIGGDVSSLNGPGTLVMTRTCSFKLTKANKTDFSTVNATYTSSANLAVLWIAPTA
jgi:hypothetical protein